MPAPARRPSPSRAADRAHRGQDLPLPACRDERRRHDQRVRRLVRDRRAPRVTTSAASSVGATTATLNGKVDPNGRSTTYLFEWGTSTSYGSKTSSSSAGSGTSAVDRHTKGISGSQARHDLPLPGRRDERRRHHEGRGPGVHDAGAAQRSRTGQAARIGPTSATLGGPSTRTGARPSWYVEFGTTASYGSKTSTRAQAPARRH